MIQVLVDKDKAIDGTTAELEREHDRELVDADVKENTLVLHFE